MDDKLGQLFNIMARLRDKESGCPWDLAQTFDSISAYTIEEAYEVLDAIQEKDYMALKSELGDILFHVVYYSQIASEKDLFTLSDVLDTIITKITTRHPHVFKELSLETPDAVNSHWEKIKKEEREQKYQGKDSVLDDIAKALPALMRAEKIQKRAKSIGFDWPDYHPVFDKIEEEMAEVKEAIDHKSQADIEDECGDLLFACVNLCRHLKVDPEVALRKANLKFETRFKKLESKAKSDNLDLNQLSLDDLESLWQRVKLQEN